MVAPRRSMDTTAGPGVAAALLGDDRLQPDGRAVRNRHAGGAGRGADSGIEAAVPGEPARHRVLDPAEAAADRLHRRGEQQLLLAAVAAHDFGGIFAGRAGDAGGHVARLGRLSFVPAADRLEPV